MIIAVPYDNGLVFGHFGHTEQFKFYEVEDRTLMSTRIVETAGQGHSALAAFLAEHQVDVVICGGIGGGAQAALAAAGIQVFGGVVGSADEAVISYLVDALRADACEPCTHHCDGHSCGDCGDGCHGHHA